MVQNSRYLKIGPGGRQCNCCFPAPRSKDRRAQFRSAKRKAERAAMKQAEADMVDQWAEMDEWLQQRQAEDQYWDHYDRDWYDADGVGYDYDPSWDEYDIGHDDYYGDLHYYPPSLQSEQEKVARALCYALIGDEHDWRQHLTSAKRFMDAMKQHTKYDIDDGVYTGDPRLPR